MWIPDEDSTLNQAGAESERDASDILENQDETDVGPTSRDDLKMGAGATNFDEDEQEFADREGHELDVKAQMDRATRAREHVDRPDLAKHH